MPKRRAALDDVDDNVLSAPPTPSKRIKTRNSSVDIVNLPPSSQPRQEESDDEESRLATQQGADAPTQPDEEEFEKQNADRLRALLESKKKVQGGVAEHGVIESIEMHQFMCHKYLTFTFGPQINFIIGHNGSGKSAVLSAITIALGGKAISTGRGNGLKSFIREGQSVSEVTISLKNQGDEAYKPNEYGKSIVITRRFTKEGSTTWKIKSKDGRVISTKKDDLAAICDHMNIQVDNPMNVLTQDAARQFLSASRPEDKYQLFLRGTQLSQLAEEYDTCFENITQTTKVLAQKKEALPDLRSAFHEAKMRYEEAAKAREQQRKLTDLKKELAWAHVKAKEEEMIAKIEEAAKASRRLPKMTESLAAAEADFNTKTTDVQKYEAEFRSLGEMAHLDQQRDALQAEIRTNKLKLSEYTKDLKQMDTSHRATNIQIEEYQKQIDEETQRLAAHNQAHQEEVLRKLEEARARVSAADNASQNSANEKNELIKFAEESRSKGKNHEKRRDELKARIQECEQMIESCRRQEKDSLVPYGRDIKLVLERIKGMRWVGDEPLGPLGVHVKAKDPHTWGELLRNQLAGSLTAFAVTNAQDQKQLKRLLQESGNHHITIMIYEKDLFDYSSGEPPEGVLTVLRALEISNPHVLRILVNTARIERQVLSNTRREAQDQLYKLRGGTAWSKDGFSVRVYPEGGVYSTSLMRKQGATSLLLTGRDTKSEIERFQNQIQSLEEEYKAETESMTLLKQTFMNTRQKIEKLKQDEAMAQEAMRRAKIDLSNLQNEVNDDMPANLAGLRAAKEEAEAEKENIHAQFQDVMTKKAAVDEKQKELINQLKVIKSNIQDFEDRRDRVRTDIENAATDRMKAEGQKQHYEDKLNEERKKVEAIEAAAEVLQVEFQNWTAKAQEFCDPVENPRKKAEVERHLASVQRALEEREKRHGASVDEMARELNKAKERFETAQKELKQMSNLNKALKTSLSNRLSRWQEFRRHIALRCKVVFQYHLSHRGYFGKVLFNHDTQTLSLKVQTDDQVATQGSRDKDPRSLSGGEKSFSTICLLLALWESIGCPLRCLDEFDVFMDAVNRRISMKMMIDTANSSDKKQYILITPQDMTNVQFGPTVRVHRMTDPERGNGVLAFTG